MTRERSGTFEPSGRWPDGAPRFRYRVRLGDGTRTRRYDVPQGLTERQARAYVGNMQAQEDKYGALLAAKEEAERREARARGVAAKDETADAWHERFLISRGESKQSDSGYRWRKWVSPTIGEKPMASVAREDIETIRDGLDEAIREHEKHGRGTRKDRRLAPKAALNIWSVVTTAFKYASQAKQRDLRVREDNPCVGVLPPEKGDSRRKEWIYPKELVALASSEDVPLPWRELYVIACYLYLRPGELFELRWKDVDLEVALVHVTRAWDWERREVKPPKTRNGIRHVPIAPALLPLLSRMAKGKKPEDKVVPILEATGKERKTSEMMRLHLQAAGVRHTRLYADNATHMPIGFRSWRDTGITWLAIAGVDVVKIQRRAGHDSLETTMGYVKAAEDVTGTVGTPFPELPSSLVWANDQPKDWPKRITIPQKNRGTEVPAQGFEPR